MKKHALILVFSFLAILWSAAPARASTSFLVNSTADKVDLSPGDGVCHTKLNTCTLRAAIQEANALGGAVTIQLDAATYTLKRVGPGEDNAALGDLDLKGNLKIVGHGQTQTIIQGKVGWNDGIFSVLSGKATLIKLKIQKGNATIGGGVFVAAGGNAKLKKSAVAKNVVGADGGGIYNAGVLSIVSSLVKNNKAPDFTGGGIFNKGGLTLTRTTITNNQADLGGGIYNAAAGGISMTASSVSANHATQGSGGGIFNDGLLTIDSSLVSANHASDSGGGLYSDDTLTMTNSTITGNDAINFGGGVAVRTLVLNGSPRSPSASTNLYYDTIVENQADKNGDGPGTGGGISGDNFSSVNLESSILALNTFGAQFGTSPDCGGTVHSNDYNLIQSTTGCTITGATGHNITGADPKISALAGNGGATKTRALRVGSPAIDWIPSGMGKCFNPIKTDQRGYSRPQDGDHIGGAACDIGAYEVQ